MYALTRIMSLLSKIEGRKCEQRYNLKKISHSKEKRYIFDCIPGHARNTALLLFVSRRTVTTAGLSLLSYCPPVTLAITHCRLR